MARLMFANENERNNNDQTSSSSIAANDNKSPDMIVMTNNKPSDSNNASSTATATTTLPPKKNSNFGVNGFKIRSHQLSPGLVSSDDKFYKMRKALVCSDSSTVARLRSKFNATSATTAIGGDKSRSFVLSKRHRGPAKVTHPPIFLRKHPEPKPITVRNSSVLEAIKFFEQDSNKGPRLSKEIVDSEGTEEHWQRVEESARNGDENDIMRLRVASVEKSQPQQHQQQQQTQKTAGDGERCDRNSKPSVQPKPTILLQKVSAGKENRAVPQLHKAAAETAALSPQKQAYVNVDKNLAPATIVVVKQFQNSHYHAPKLLLKKEKSLSASDYQSLMAKSKRLSIAKDFALESVLNADMDNRSCENGDGDEDDATVAEVKTKPTVSEINSSSEKENVSTNRDKMANNSFLHKYLEQCLEGHQIKGCENVVSATKMSTSGKDGSVASDFSCAPISEMGKNVENSSALHDILMRTFNNNNNNNKSGIFDESHCDEVIYEDLPSPKASDHENHYVDIKDEDLSSVDLHDGNVYDDVIYAQLYHNAEVENYETIASVCEVYSNLSNEMVTKEDDPVATAAQIISRSGSDSSFDHANSLYDLKPTSDFSSATASTFSSSNDCINIKIESPYVYVANSKSSCSDIGEDEVITDDWDTDENDHQEIIVYTERSNPNRRRKFKKRKFKFLLRQKNCVESPPVVEEIPNFMDDLVDDFDSSSSDLESSEMNGHIEAVNHLNKSRSVSSSHSQNIYGFVEKARKTVRKSWSSLNQIRKLSVGNISNNLQLKIPETQTNRSKSVSVEEINVKNGHSVSSGGSVRWTSFKSKFRPRYSTVNSSTSIFYLNPEELCFDKSETVVNRKQNNVNNRRRRMTCIELRPTRPTSPPPPPPVDRPKSTDNHSISNSNIYSDRSNSSYESRNSVNGADVSFDLNSSRSSDLHLRFADEPLYQFYAESIVKLTTNASMDCLTDSDGYEEIASTTSRPTAMELIIPSPNGHGQHRSLWCEVDEVKNSGILETLSPSRQRLQEAIFEIITSEASYYKSLSVLDKIFSSNPLLKDENLLTKNDWKILFGNVTAVRKCSEKLLAALETCWQESILLTGLCDVIYKHASENFRIYVKYCSNQIYIDRTLKKLKEQNLRFIEVISQLEANPMCQSLSLHSFLMLPMQRITRMPLLLDAVLSRMDPLTDSDEYKTYQITLATLNKIVKECNETARKLERYEEMLLLSGQLEFSRKAVKMFSVASSSRWLIRSGPMVQINPQDIKLTFTKKLTKQTTKFYFFLFNDILVVAKKKSEDTYVVFDYCARNMIQMTVLDDNCASAYKYLLMLTILENHEGKTVEMVLSCDSDSTRQRWLEATSSHLTSDNPEEKLYEEWDCPQVSAIHAYTALQPDELSLQAGDVVKVLKKTTDGWCHGERIRDGSTGWFPGNYTVEIASQHMRAKNLRLRHRLLTLSGNYLQYQQQKKC